MGTIRALLPARAAVLIAALCFNAQLFAQSAAKQQPVIQVGADVAFDYTLTDDDGKVIDSSKGKAPMNYTHGKGQIIPGLEKAMAGMALGAEKNNGQAGGWLRAGESTGLSGGAKR